MHRRVQSVQNVLSPIGGDGTVLYERWKNVPTQYFVLGPIINTL